MRKIRTNRKIVVGYPAKVVKPVNLSSVLPGYKIEADKAFARIIVSRLLANEYLKLRVW